MFIKKCKEHLVIVDDDDRYILESLKWSENRSGAKIYIFRTEKINGKKTTKMLHRVIKNAPKGFVVDHINGNTLDNRKCNLRICTTSQNIMNSKKGKNKNIYKGVHFHKNSGKWVSTITLNYKHKHLGYFKTDREAAIAYNEAAKEIFGQFAKLNII